MCCCFLGKQSNRRFLHLHHKVVQSILSHQDPTTKFLWKWIPEGIWASLIAITKLFNFFFIKRFMCTKCTQPDLKTAGWSGTRPLDPHRTPHFSGTLRKIKYLKQYWKLGRWWLNWFELVTTLQFARGWAWFVVQVLTKTGSQTSKKLRLGLSFPN